MKAQALLSAVVFAAGCGFSVDSSYYGDGYGYDYGRPQPTPHVPAYLIDPGAGANLYDTTYAITTNGTDWVLSWLGDGNFHTFSGGVQSGSRIDGVLFDGGFAGDRVLQPQLNQISFDASTDGGNIQAIQFSSPSQPLRFDLYIDGAPALLGATFSSSGIESTNDAIPFDLATDIRLVTVPTSPQRATSSTGTERPRATFIAPPAEKTTARAQ